MYKIVLCVVSLVATTCAYPAIGDAAPGAPRLVKGEDPIYHQTLNDPAQEFGTENADNDALEESLSDQINGTLSTEPESLILENQIEPFENPTESEGKRRVRRSNCGGLFGGTSGCDDEKTHQLERELMQQENEALKNQIAVHKQFTDQDTKGLQHQLYIQQQFAQQQTANLQHQWSVANQIANAKHDSVNQMVIQQQFQAQNNEKQNLGNQIFKDQLAQLRHDQLKDQVSGQGLEMMRGQMGGRLNPQPQPQPMYVQLKYPQQCQTQPQQPPQE